MPITIAIFEDHPDLREGLVQLIRGSKEFHCIGAWDNCNDIPSIITDSTCDVVVMDIGLPGRSGIEGVKEIKFRYPSIDVVMLTVYEDEQRIFDSILAGASGYLLKGTPPQKILEAIKDIHHGGAHMTGTIAKKVLSMFHHHVPAVPKDFGLSVREEEVLQFLVKGYSYKMIAEKIFISIDTVRSHIKNIYEKLHVHSKSEAVAKALKNKLV